MVRRTAYLPHPAPEDLGGGWWLNRHRHRTWTEYAVMKLDAPGGFVVDGKCKFGFSRKRDALAWHAEQVKA